MVSEITGLSELVGPVHASGSALECRISLSNSYDMV